MTPTPDTLQNLKDAGCPKKVIHAFLTACEDNRETDAIQLLKDHRRNLLEQVHNGEARIACLDYLLYQMKSHYKA